VNRVLIIADDATGANASAAMFSASGLNAVTVDGSASRGQVDVIRGTTDVVVCNTATRLAEGARAAQAVAQAATTWWPADLVAKRIDSTLRGNITHELAALLETVGALSGRRPLGVVCAAHPLAGRSTIDGFQHIQGVRLEHAGPSMSVSLVDSHVATLLRAGSRLSGREVMMANLRRGADDCKDELESAIDNDENFVSYDSETLGDVQLVAGAIAGLLDQRPDIIVITVDPGPLTHAVGHMIRTRPGPRGPVLVALGSVTGITRQQLAALMSSQQAATVPIVEPTGHALLSVPDVVAEVQRALDRTGPKGSVVLSSIPDRGFPSSSLGSAIPRAMAAVVRSCLDQRSYAGLFLSGGEVASAVINALSAIGLRTRGEVVPLTVSGSLVGGPWSGLEVITKGGLVGGEGLLARCVELLHSDPDISPTQPHVNERTMQHGEDPR
jgi:uncharacterized protein YgbK (DUF1537 family)